MKVKVKYIPQQLLTIKITLFIFAQLLNLSACGFIFNDFDTKDWNTSQGIAFQGENVNSYFGSAVDYAGDVNNDTFGDIIIGSYGKKAAYVFFGTNNPPSSIDHTSGTFSPNQGFGIVYPGSGSCFGYFVSRAGDIDGDGISDVIISSFCWNIIGTAYVIYGRNNFPASIDVSSASFTPSDGFKIWDANATPDVGFAFVAGRAGDFNGDNFDDVLVTAHGQDNLKGAVYVIYGSNNYPADIDVSSVNFDSSKGFKVWDAIGLDNDQFGYAASFAGDVNDDGIDDIIIGARGYDTNRGVVYVIYGRKDSPSIIDVSSPSFSPSHGFKIWDSSATINALLGTSVSFAGDTNGDNIDDVIIGSSGTVFVIYGNKNFPSSIDISPANFDSSKGYKIWDSNANTNSSFGVIIKPAGDFNGDTLNDVMIFSQYDSSKGANYVIYGSQEFRQDVNVNALDFNSSKGFRVHNSSANPSDSYGNRFGFAGDFNNDQIDDILIFSSHWGSKTGIGYLLYGRKCLEDNCVTCVSESFCQVCASGYSVSNGTCITISPDPSSPSNSSNSSNPSNPLNPSNPSDPPDPDTLFETIHASYEMDSFIASILLVGKSISLRLGLVNKMIQNTRYIDIPYSPQLEDIFLTYETSIFQFSFPNIDENALDSKEMSTVFAKYKSTSSFLLNFWETLILTSGGLVIFIIIKIIGFSISDLDKKTTLNSIIKHLKISALNFLVITLYGSLDDVVFFAILDLKFATFGSALSSFSSLFSISFLAFALVLVCYYFWILYKYQSLKKQGPNKLKSWRSKNKHLKAFYQDFKDTDWIIQTFFILCIMRCLLASLIFTTLTSYPLLQTTFLFILTSLFIAFMVIKKPFLESLQFIIQLFCEIVILVVNIIDIIIAMKNQEETPVDPLTIEKLCTGIIVLNYIIIIASIIVLLIEISQKINETYKAWKSKRNNPKKITHKTVQIFPIVESPTEDALNSNSFSLEAQKQSSPNSINQDLKETSIAQHSTQKNLFDQSSFSLSSQNEQNRNVDFLSDFERTTNFNVNNRSKTGSRFRQDRTNTNHFQRDAYNPTSVELQNKTDFASRSNRKMLKRYRAPIQRLPHQRIDLE